MPRHPAWARLIAAATFLHLGFELGRNVRYVEAKTVVKAGLFSVASQLNDYGCWCDFGKDRLRGFAVLGQSYFQ